MSNTFDYNYIYENTIGSKNTDFLYLNEIGRGSFGIVYKVQSLMNNKTYAIKKLNLRNMKEEHQRETMEEVLILKNVNHDHVIKCFTSFLEDEYLYIVMEYAEGGDLYTVIHILIKKIKELKKKKELLNEDILWEYAYEIFLGIRYLHSINVIHRDIKCLNIFIKNRMIKIGDLGVSKIVGNLEQLSPSKVGTPSYSSPELINSRSYDYKIDIWAIGCCLYHLANLELPFIGESLEILSFKITNERQKYLKNYSSELNHFIDKLLVKLPYDRLSSKEVLESYFPTNVKLAYIGKRKKLEEFEKIRDEFDYEKVYLCKMPSVELNKLDNKMIKIKKEINLKVNDNNISNKDKITTDFNSQERVKDNNIFANEIDTHCKLNQKNNNKNNYLINNIPNNFKGLLTIKENKSKRKILINKENQASLNIPFNQESKIIINRINHSSACNFHIDDKYNDIKDSENKINSGSENKFKNYINPSLLRPFTAPEEVIEVETVKKREIKSISLLKKLSTKIKLVSPNLNSSKCDKNITERRSLAKIPMVKSISESTEIVNNIEKPNLNNLSLFNKLTKSKTGLCNTSKNFFNPLNSISQVGI